MHSGSFQTNICFANRRTHLIVYWKNDNEFGEIITHFEIEDDANNNPMNILNLLNSQFNLEWKE